MIQMNNMIEGKVNTTNFLSQLNIPSKLKKLFKLSKFPLIATLSFDPTITAGIGMLYVAGEGIISQIEMQNMKVFLEEYIDRGIDDCLRIEEKSEQELITLAITKSLRCTKDSQIKRIIDIVQETLENDEIKIDEAEDFINVVSELSEREAILLARCYKYFADGLHSKFTIDNKEIFGNLKRDSWDYLLNRLEGKGLLNSEPMSVSWEDIDVITAGDSKEKTIEDNSNKGDLFLNKKTYFQTDFGSRLFKSLKNGNIS